MKKLISVSFLLYIVLNCFSCGESTDDDHFDSKVILSKVGQIELSLDSLTANVVTSYFHLKTDSTDYFALLNIYTNSIYLYDLETSLLDRIISYPEEGPNGVGKFTNVTEFVMDGDTTFFYDRTKKVLYVSGADKELLLKHPFGMMNPESPYGMWGDWISKTDRNIYNLSGAVVKYSFQDIPYGLDSLEFELNLMTNEVKKSFLPIPIEYVNGSWLTESLRYYRVFDSGDRSFIYSWPISDSIFVKAPDNKISSFYLGSDKVKQRIPLPQNKEKVLMDFQRKASFLYEQGSYANLYYSPEQSLFMRFAYSGVKDGQVDANAPYADTTLYEKYIILGDENFNKVGEFRSNQYSPNAVLFREGYIYLLRNTDDEDHLVFDKFELISNEN
ncbi:uncharacterized protein DUF4221 [Roseivirga pacifica]|uniref:DUF4221 domain-containing protein n=1 Tax=Roseivirga pacifica TaxID=1267423 RepID=A0A1I0MRV5_9BACT|nr:DUF4221 family protein [Roseivirga pacifica]RKQ50628.1 uncharacterized protein DUF4221 [Roseivirga pacifica]SEV91061.1 protein of unknown function [Roseivirga pacifica]